MKAPSNQPLSKPGEFAHEAIPNADLARVLEKRNEECAALSKTVDSIAFSLSHELRASLRALEGFSQVLAEDNRSELAPEIQRYLTLLYNEAAKAARLVDDLVSLCRSDTATDE